MDDVAVTVRRTEEIGGLTIKAPAFYPSDESPYLEWAIMQDPFGNQFCFVRWPLEPREVAAEIPAQQSWLGTARAASKLGSLPGGRHPR